MCTRRALCLRTETTASGGRPEELITVSFPGMRGGVGVLYIFWVRGRAIGKGIDFHDFGIRNGINFHDFGIRNGINFHNFRNWYRVGYAFSENWYKVRYIFLKNWYKSGIHFGKFGIRNGYVFETLMARSRPKFGQVPPSPAIIPAI